MPAPFNAPFWTVAFRPFFLGGGLYAVLSIALWGLYYSGHYVHTGFFDNPIIWHAHEMIFGFTMAIVAGFLLTAVANWTGSLPIRKGHLAGLFLCWVTARVLMNIPTQLPSAFIMAVHLSFIPLLAVSIAVPLLRRWNKRNFIFLLLLGLLFACQTAALLTHSLAPLYGALMVILVIVSLIGGRIIPAFTVAALRRRGQIAYQTPQPKLDILALVSLLAVGGTLLFYGAGTGLAFGAAAAAIIHLLRLRHYHTRKTLTDPLVWILHAGYIWLVIGLVLVAGYGLGWLALSPALHALTVGCIGSMTLGMMCRVTLGHTGRNLEINTLTAVAFCLMQLAALVRVFVPVFYPAYFTQGILASSSLWAVCFVIYLGVFGKYLFLPRPDKTLS